MNTQAKKFTLAFLCTLTCVLALPKESATAQAPINRAEIVQILDGTNVFIQNKQAKVKDTANKGQRVRTGDARAQLLFNTGAIGRLAPNSVLTVGQCARLEQGTLLVNGAMNGCTSSVVAGVRGTTYILEVDEAGDAQIKVLEGTVTVTRTSQDPSEPAFVEAAEEVPVPLKVRTKQLQAGELEDRPTYENSEVDSVTVKGGEQVSINSEGIPGEIEEITQEEFTQLLTSSLFNGFSIPLPGLDAIQSTFESLFPDVPFPISLPSIPGIPGIPGFSIPLPFF